MGILAEQSVVCVILMLREVFFYEKIYKNEDCNECRAFNFSRQWRQEYKRSLEV